MRGGLAASPPVRAAPRCDPGSSCEGLPAGRVGRERQSGATKGETTMTTYTTYGSVRGGCGHRHKTIRAAEHCLDRDQRGCSSQGGYSDRSVCEVRNGCLYEVGGNDTDWIAGEGGRSCGAARM